MLLKVRLPVQGTKLAFQTPFLSPRLKWRLVGQLVALEGCVDIRAICLTHASDYQRTETECDPFGVALLEVLATVTELKIMMLGLEILEDHPTRLCPELVRSGDATKVCVS